MWMKTKPRDSIILATKVAGAANGWFVPPVRHGLTAIDSFHIERGIEGSLKNLGTDYIDLYQVHGFDPCTPFQETLEALDSLVRSGKVRYIGCSNLAAWHIMKAHGISAQNHLSSFVSLQAYYTIAGRDLERELVPMLLDQKMGLMVWSPLAGGFLSGKYNRDTESNEGRRANFDFPPINKPKGWDIIDAMRDFAFEKQVTVAQIALAWLLHQPVVTSVIIGANRPDQLADNLNSVHVQLTDVELSKLNEVSKLNPEYPGWMIDRQGRDRK
jgi:aryl-alcohol dehydrogenase-like predicted oxidoreductase